jgi:hypothetical protein
MHIWGAILCILIGIGLQKIGITRVGGFLTGIGIISIIIMLVQCGK